MALAVPYFGPPFVPDRDHVFTTNPDWTDRLPFNVKSPNDMHQCKVIIVNEIMNNTDGRCLVLYPHRNLNQQTKNVFDVILSRCKHALIRIACQIVHEYVEVFPLDQGTPEEREARSQDHNTLFKYITPLVKVVFEMANQYFILKKGIYYHLNCGKPNNSLDWIINTACKHENIFSILHNITVFGHDAEQIFTVSTNFKMRVFQDLLENISTLVPLREPRSDPSYSPVVGLKLVNRNLAMSSTYLGLTQRDVKNVIYKFEEEEKGGMLVLSKKQKKPIGHDYMTEIVKHRYQNPTSATKKRKRKSNLTSPSGVGRFSTVITNVDLFEELHYNKTEHTNPDVWMNEYNLGGIDYVRINDVIRRKIEPMKSLKDTWYKSDVSQLKYCVEKAMDTYTTIKLTKIEERDNVMNEWRSSWPRTKDYVTHLTLQSMKHYKSVLRQEESFDYDRRQLFKDSFMNQIDKNIKFKEDTWISTFLRTFGF